MQPLTLDKTPFEVPVNVDFFNQSNGASGVTIYGFCTGNTSSATNPSEIYTTEGSLMSP